MADVVVCDAVLGNVVIKFFEGLSAFIFDQFRARVPAGVRGRLAYLLLRPGHRAGSGTCSTTRSSAGRRCSASGGP